METSAAIAPEDQDRSITTDPHGDPRVRARQVELLYEGLPLSLFATVLLGTFLAYFLAPSMGSGLAWGWLLVTLLIAAGRGADRLAFRRSVLTEHSAENWLNRFTLGALLAGAGWAFAGWTLFPMGNPEAQALLTLTLAGIAAGAVTTLSPRRRTIVPYVVLILLPLFFRFLMAGKATHLAVSIMIVLFGVVVLGAAYRIGLTLTESASLRLQAVDREQDLAASRDLLLHTGDLARVGGWEFSVRRGTMRWTAEMYRIHELPTGTEPDVEGVLNFFSPEVREEVRDAFTRAIEEAEPFDLEVPFTTARGHRLWVRAKGQPVESHGRVVSVRGALQDITEQKKQKNELQKAIDALSLVYRFTGNPDLELSARMEEVLRFGTVAFGVPVGLVSRIEDDLYTVLHVHDEEGKLEPGAAFPLGESYCSRTVQVEEAVAVHHAERSDLRAHPAYPKQRMETYIGAPIRVQGRLYGTIAFLGRAPRAQPFSEIELSLIRLFAQWVGNELGRDLSILRLAESEERFQLAVRGSSDGIWDSDLVRDEIFYSPRFKQLIGFAEEEFPNEVSAWRDRIHPDDRERADAALMGHIREQKPYALEYRVLHSTGEYRWFLARGQAVWGEDGKAVRMAGSLTDITGQKQDRQRLEEALGLQRALLDATPYGIISTDLHGVIRSINQAAAGMLVVEPEDMVGTATPLRFYREDEIDSRRRALPELGEDAGPLEVILHSARSGRVEEGEWTLERADESSFPAAVSTAPIQGRDDETVGFVFVFIDLTERKKVERLKNEFVSTVSHELRTPLTSITGALALLLKGVGGELGEQAHSLVELAHRNGERLILLINDILDMERISAGEMRFEFQVQEVMPLIEQALEATAPYGENFDVQFELASRLEGARVDVDAHRFGQVMANLLSNAAKFSGEGTTVRVRTERVGPFVRISVTDRGPGIPEEFQDRIFQKFSQADGSDVRELGGTGLGLAISKAIVSKMNGRIDFETEAGVGTTLYFDLPEWISHELSAEDSVEGERVLVIEDDPEVAQVLMLMLREQGYDPVVAPDGDAARARLEREEFDAITLDLTLPDIDGLELLMELREAGAATPVVVVSATAEERRKKTGADVVDWLQKPIRPEELAGALSRSTAQKKGRIRILHVEDDDTLARVVSTSASEEWEFRWAGTVRRAKEALGKEAFDVVLLDLGLPDGSGWDLIEAIRNNEGDPEVIVFSASELSRSEAESVERTVVKARSTPEELLQTIREMLGESSNRAEAEEE